MTLLEIPHQMSFSLFEKVELTQVLLTVYHNQKTMSIMSFSQYLSHYEAQCLNDYLQIEPGTNEHNYVSQKTRHVKSSSSQNG